jgi:catechol 2,3-dioxygenase-like lactoylglutathione lyase family enzyme
MLDHVSIPVRDGPRAAAFYDAVLAAIGLRRVKEVNGAIGYGREAVGRYFGLNLPGSCATVREPRARESDSTSVFAQTLVPRFMHFTRQHSPKVVATRVRPDRGRNTHRDSMAHSPSIQMVSKSRRS